MDVLALHEELRATARARTTLSHYAMLDARRTTLALVGFWRSPRQMEQEPDSIATIERVVHALTGEKSEVDTGVMKVLARREDVANPDAAASPRRVVVTDMSFAQPLPGDALTDLLDLSRDALREQDGFRTCCLLTDPDRSRLVHLSFWDGPVEIDPPSVERLIVSLTLREPPAPPALTTSAHEFNVLGAQVHRK